MSDATTTPAPARLDRLRERLDKAGFTALLLTSPAGRRHVLGARGEPVGEPAVVLTAEGAVVSATGGDAAAAILAAVRSAGASSGTIGVDVDLPWEVFGEVSSAGPSLRPAADLVFAELATGTAEEITRFGAAAELAAVGYTAVMDHLRVGLDLRELSANVDRSIRRTGGLLGWPDPHGVDHATAGSDLVTVRGHDPRTATLTATSPVRYVLHPLLDGVAGYAAATALLSKAEGGLRAAAERCAAATAALLAALRPGAQLRAGRDAFGRAAGDHPARCRVLALRGGAAHALPRNSELVAEPGMVLGVHTAIGAPSEAAVELAETVLLTDTGAEPLAGTPLRLVELY